MDEINKYFILACIEIQKLLLEKDVYKSVSEIEKEIKSKSIESKFEFSNLENWNKI
jgi:hypothetical protein